MPTTQAARLAQSVEHETLNLRVVGSSPTLGDQLFRPLNVEKSSFLIMFGILPLPYHFRLGN